jgi:zinc/manganese transport system permease protein
MIDLLALPFLACLVLAGIHAYLGLHVLARGIIFVDLALAQVAALGMTAALLAGHAPESDGAYAWAVAFTIAGALVFAATRRAPGAVTGAAVPQEAIIGIVYAVTAALTVLVLDRVAQGGEQIKQLLVGSILGVTREDVGRLAALYGGIGAVHWLCRRPLLALSHGADVRGSRAWDFLFYLTFGLVVTSSVRIAGVLLVFSYLIVPAVIGVWLASTIGRRLVVGWVVGFAVSVAGLAASFVWDLPTGATVVATFGALLALVALAVGVVGLSARVRREGRRALAAAGVVTGLMVAIAGLALAAFPRADHLWLDALERVFPALQAPFLTAHERRAAADARESVARGARELGRLRALAADVQWGRRELPSEQRERLRQFLTGRDELVAGDTLVLGTLRGHARERQRLVVGLPLAAAGGGVALLSLRVARQRRAGRSPVVEEQVDDDARHRHVEPDRQRPAGEAHVARELGREPAIDRGQGQGNDRGGQHDV